MTVDAKRDQLLTECVLSDEVGFTTCQVGGSAESNRVAGRLGEMQEGIFTERKEADDQLGERMQESEHEVGLQERDFQMNRASGLYLVCMWSQLAGGWALSGQRVELVVRLKKTTVALGSESL